ncbi:neurotrophin-7 [Salmo salar]|uniref:Neurotrophin-7 n=1 Tax=Salmo salar TaxID=8030 RepID=A0ABM3D157_SALSA|nr:neurotrophin-7 [Salmo salar]|eukprot:XP_014039496.1 PREDICTED: nerve growth factor-like [Salmo salar]
MRSLLLVLLLIGVQAVLNMGGALGPVAANHSAEHHTVANGRAEQQRADRLSVSPQQEQQTQQRPSRTRQAHRPASLPQDRSSSLGHSETGSPSTLSIPEVDPKLFSKLRYHSSPRVVFSDVPPSHRGLGGETREEEGEEEVGRVMDGGVRVRRKAGGQPMHRGEYSVCDSISVWLGNLTKATDIAGNEVEVLPEVKIDNVRKKQFFYETTCRVATPPGLGAGAGAGGGVMGGGPKAGAKSGCRGIDSRHWNSYCTNTHTYVLALTKSKEQTAWRLIRINAACVCVLSRKSWRH